MYFCALEIFVMSTSRSDAKAIADLFRESEPPEDCAYHLEMAGYDDSFDVGADSAVIIDRDAEALRKYKRRCDELVVFLASANDLSEIDSETLSTVDDLWVLPEKQADGSRLLKLYFSKLLKTLKDNSDRRRMEICFHTIIDSLPDLVWFKDNDGAHLIVNDEFCGVVEKTKQQIYKQHHNYIWDVPEDDYENGEVVCRKSEDIVVQARKTCQFEEKIKTKYGMRQLVTYKSPLIDADGSIFGTCGIGHDITDLQNVTNELRIMIDSIPFGVAIVDSNGDVIAINRFLHSCFPDAANSVGHNFEEWSNGLPKEKLGTDQEEDEYRIYFGEQEHIMRFRKEPIFDIFGDHIGNIQFIRDVTIQYNYEQQNLRYANTDFLTGLYNRRSLFNYLSALEEDSKISLIMMDLDHFKSVNDTYGHAAGDEALEITSRVLEKCFPDGFISRLGGDEFLVALVGEYELPQVEERTQQLLDTLLEDYTMKEEFQTLSASAGIVQERLHECDIASIEDLIKRSDAALYTAKDAGRSRYCVSH
jgi:diguanylate cyclase (GGDEF)-like protein/PAS domain S-box-containing protein